ncbi:MAG: glycosyltransferase family 1 protein [bacterium]|nr:glycosyltransferase family 1 protein [bacterium]
MRIIFYMYEGTGHINASVKLAKRLQARGHHVAYLTPSYKQEALAAQGLESIPVLEKIYGSGTAQPQPSEIAKLKGVARVWTLRKLAADEKISLFDAAVLQQSLKNFVAAQQPDCFIIDSMLPRIALSVHSLHIPLMLLAITLPRQKDRSVPPLMTPIIPHNSVYSKLLVSLSWRVLSLMTTFMKLLEGDTYHARQYKQLARQCGYPTGLVDTQAEFIPHVNMPELILCPQEFDFPRKSAHNIHYVEASIDTERKEIPFPWEDIDKNKPLIYCSLGTESYIARQCQEFLQSVILAAAERSQWQFVLATGDHIDPQDFHSVPANVVLLTYAPQIGILRQASLMLTHGGLGSIKECIYFGVPMIVFPLGRDQPGNAARVAYHKLGLVGNIKKSSAQELNTLLETIMQESGYRERVRRMGEIFRQIEDAGKGVELIEAAGS